MFYISWFNGIIIVYVVNVEKSDVVIQLNVLPTVSASTIKKTTCNIRFLDVFATKPKRRVGSDQFNL